MAWKVKLTNAERKLSFQLFHFAPEAHSNMKATVFYEQSLAVNMTLLGNSKIPVWLRFSF
jgi:hypothetical protein